MFFCPSFNLLDNVHLQARQSSNTGFSDRPENVQPSESLDLRTLIHLNRNIQKADWQQMRKKLTYQRI